MQYEDKFVAFVDILGWRQIVKASEEETGRSLPELLDALSKLGTQEDQDEFNRTGPTICPMSRRTQKNLNFKITQVSDCAIVSAEVSPAGAINLIAHCHRAVLGLLIRKGMICRGYITRGNIYHDGLHVVGSGYQKAYSYERCVRAFAGAGECGTPFVELEPAVTEYIQDKGDDCIRTIFDRLVRTEDGITAVFPFPRLVIDPNMSELNTDKADNQINRQNLQSVNEQLFRYIDRSDEKAMKKARHYEKAVAEQLKRCDKIDTLLDKLGDPFPAVRQ